jgi:hypothetical protein
MVEQVDRLMSINGGVSTPKALCDALGIRATAGDLSRDDMSEMCWGALEGLGGQGITLVQDGRAYYLVVGFN